MKKNKKKLRGKPGRSRAAKHEKQHSNKQKRKGGGSHSQDRHDKRGGNNQKHQKRNQRIYVGRVQKNARGFAFLLPLDRTQEDVYVSKFDAADLMSDDVVEYTVHRDGKRASGEIVKILERGKKEVLGRVEFSNNNSPVVVTTDGEVFFLLASSKKYKERDWVIGRIERYPNRHNYGEAALIEWIGPELTPKYDYRIAMAEYGLQEKFPGSALDEAEDFDDATAEEVAAIASNQSSRRDLRSMPFVTIDGETAKDFDDAILVEKAPKGNGYILYVAIADVSYFVRPFTALDKAARARATSVYFPGFCLPMLPEKLSNDLCSLRPKVDRLSLCAEIHYDRTGRVNHTDFYEGVIKTAARLTYNEVHAFITKQTEPPTVIAQPMKNAYELYRLLKNERAERGVLDFDLPETEIVVNEEGKPIATRRAERHESHQLIEEFMIAANRAVAFALKDANVPALYRVHERPSPDSVDEVNSLMKNLGINLRLTETTPRAMSKILEETKHLPQAKTLHQSVLRLQKQARYEPDPKGHFGLALEDYAHFTSPIRRYPDLVVHRALKTLLLSLEGENSDNDTESEDLDELGLHTSAMERRAMEAERFVVKRKQCWFMADKLGQIFEATVSGITERGVFVEIVEFGTEGFIPMEQMGGFFVYDERHLCLRERPGHSTIQLGDQLTVQLVRVSVEDRQIEFVRQMK